jgi:hypothetical protein
VIVHGAQHVEQLSGCNPTRAAVALTVRTVSSKNCENARICSSGGRVMSMTTPGATSAPLATMKFALRVVSSSCCCASACA